MTSKLEPAIWPRDTGQRILCFDRCQLIMAWMSNIKEVHGKPRLYVSGNLLFGLWPPCCATRRRAYAPASNTANHDNHEKINSWVSFSFLYVFEYRAPLGGPSGRWSSAMIVCDYLYRSKTEAFSNHSFNILRSPSYEPFESSYGRSSWQEIAKHKWISGKKLQEWLK